MQKEIEKKDIRVIAEEAAKKYKKVLFALSEMEKSEYFDKAEDCYRAGYERALLDIIEGYDVATFQLTMKDIHQLKD